MPGRRSGGGHRCSVQGRPPKIVRLDRAPRHGARTSQRTERTFMSRVLPRRLVVLLTASFALVLMAMAFSVSSASATGFCGGARVNNINKCFGAARVFTTL